MPVVWVILIILCVLYIIRVVLCVWHAGLRRVPVKITLRIILHRLLPVKITRRIIYPRILNRHPLRHGLNRVYLHRAGLRGCTLGPSPLRRVWHGGTLNGIALYRNPLNRNPLRSGLNRVCLCRAGLHRGLLRGRCRSCNRRHRCLRTLRRHPLNRRPLRQNPLWVSLRGSPLRAGLYRGGRRGNLLRCVPLRGHLRLLIKGIHVVLLLFLRCVGFGLRGLLGLFSWLCRRGGALIMRGGNNS